MSTREQSPSVLLTF